MKGSIVVEKYVCMNCGRKFVSWGAEKLDFTCPTEGCDEHPLIRFGTDEAQILDGSSKGKSVKKRQVIVPRADVDYSEEDLDEDYSDDDDVELSEEEEDEDEQEGRKPVILSDGDDDKGESDTDDLTVIDEDEDDLSSDLDDEDSLEEDFEEE